MNARIKKDYLNELNLNSSIDIFESLPLHGKDFTSWKMMGANY